MQERWSREIRLKPSLRHRAPLFMISTLGRIAVNYNKRGFPCFWRFLHPCKNFYGYRVFGWQGFIFFVHREVLRAFIGEPPEKHEACHNDGSRDNNRLENLRWDTRAGNLADTLRHGTHNRGSNNPRAKLTNKQVASLRRLRRDGKSLAYLAGRFKVSLSCVSMAANGRTYQTA